MVGAKLGVSDYLSLVCREIQQLDPAQIEKVWKESYAMLDGVAVPIDAETMVRYGVSSNPTLVLVDRKSLVRLYTPTRMSEEELSRRIEELLAE